MKKISRPNPPEPPEPPDEPGQRRAAGKGIVLQVGANEGQIMTVYIESMNAENLGLTDSGLQTGQDATAAITQLDGALDKVAEQRASLGAYQNRLEHTISGLSVSAENLSAAQSRISDADMAKEMAALMKINILIQAGMFILVQANHDTESILQLLR